MDKACMDVYGQDSSSILYATRIIAIRNRKIEKDIVFPFLMTMVE